MTKGKEEAGSTESEVSDVAPRRGGLSGRSDRRSKNSQKNRKVRRVLKGKHNWGHIPDIRWDNDRLIDETDASKHKKNPVQGEVEVESILKRGRKKKLAASSAESTGSDDTEPESKKRASVASETSQLHANIKAKANELEVVRERREELKSLKKSSSESEGGGGWSAQLQEELDKLPKDEELKREMSTLFQDVASTGGMSSFDEKKYHELIVGAMRNDKRLATPRSKSGKGATGRVKEGRGPGPRERPPDVYSDAPDATRPPIDPNEIVSKEHQEKIASVIDACIPQRKAWKWAAANVTKLPSGMDMASFEQLVPEKLEMLNALEPINHKGQHILAMIAHPEGDKCRGTIEQGLNEFNQRRLGKILEPEETALAQMWEGVSDRFSERGSYEIMKPIKNAGRKTIRDRQWSPKDHQQFADQFKEQGFYTEDIDKFPGEVKQKEEEAASDTQSASSGQSDQTATTAETPKAKDNAAPSSAESGASGSTVPATPSDAAPSSATNDKAGSTATSSAGDSSADSNDPKPAEPKPAGFQNPLGATSRRAKTFRPQENLEIEEILRIWREPLEVLAMLIPIVKDVDKIIALLRLPMYRPGSAVRNWIRAKQARRQQLAYLIELSEEAQSAIRNGQMPFFERTSKRERKVVEAVEKQLGSQGAVASQAAPQSGGGGRGGALPPAQNQVNRVSQQESPSSPLQAARAAKGPPPAQAQPSPQPVARPSPSAPQSTANQAASVAPAARTNTSPPLPRQVANRDSPLPSPAPSGRPGYQPQGQRMKDSPPRPQPVPTGPRATASASLPQNQGAQQRAPQYQPPMSRAPQYNRPVQQQDMAGRGDWREPPAAIGRQPQVGTTPNYSGQVRNPVNGAGQMNGRWGNGGQRDYDAPPVNMTGGQSGPSYGGQGGGGYRRPAPYNYSQGLGAQNGGAPNYRSANQRNGAPMPYGGNNTSRLTPNNTRPFAASGYPNMPTARQGMMPPRAPLNTPLRNGQRLNRGLQEFGRGGGRFGDRSTAGSTFGSTAGSRSSMYPELNDSSMSRSTVDPWSRDSSQFSQASGTGGRGGRGGYYDPRRGRRGGRGWLDPRWRGRGGRGRGGMMGNRPFDPRFGDRRPSTASGSAWTGTGSSQTPSSFVGDRTASTGSSGSSHAWPTRTSRSNRSVPDADTEAAQQARHARVERAEAVARQQAQQMALEAGRRFEDEGFISGSGTGSSYANDSNMTSVLRREGSVSSRSTGSGPAVIFAVTPSYRPQ